ncbi:MAG TPA: ABC transporter permease [Bryobacteraceae bacterium]|nr:ABC transporter permease [Bryobacteraceae bacterium]
MQISPGENIRMAVDAVRSHKFRSMLTILGIVIGITTVVTVSSLLTGVRKGVVVFFEEFGPDNMFLTQFSGDPSRGFAPAKELKRRPVTPDYAETIKRLAPSVMDASVNIFIPGFVNNRPITARVPGFESDTVSIVGCTANGFTLQPRELKSGRVFTTEEGGRGARVALIGSSVADALFPGIDAVGNSLTVSGAELQVIGVFAPAKGGFFGENNLDKQITIPLRTAQLRYPQIDRYMIVAKAYPGQRDQAFDEIQSIARRLRHTPSGAPNDFNLSTPDQIVAQFDKITGLIGVISIAISALGLLVGGIGVMNIMLVSVTERTREIGVRKAVGARRFDIVFQFLMEAVTLTGIGGIVGVIFSITVTLVVSALVPSLPSEVPAWAVIAGLTVSVMVGVFFGVWPAFKAARLDPVEALRYE